MNLLNLPTDIVNALHERAYEHEAVPQSMPPGFYQEPSLLPLELEKVFHNGWICVGRADQVPSTGDYYTLDLLDEPLIVIRQSDNTVCVLSNVCRHRGSQILTGSGTAKRLTCPYHKWSYKIDGELKSAPLVQDQANFDKAKCKLPSFSTAEWMGWVFVNMDGHAEDFQDQIVGLDSHVQNYHAEQMRTAGAASENWPLNWKCLAENFMEGYHLTPVHRHTLHPMTPTKLCSKVEAGAGFTAYKSHYSPSFSGRTQTHPDMTEEECKLSMMVWIYPSFVAAISPSSAVYMSITPQGPSSLQTQWGVVAREQVFDEGEAQERFDFAKSFNLEDRERLMDVQKGLKSRYAVRGYLAPPDYEGCVWDFYGYMASKLTS